MVDMMDTLEDAGMRALQPYPDEGRDEKLLEGAR